MKLIKFEPNKAKLECVDFLFERKDKKQIVITLREKSNWPLIWCQNLDKVEKWIFETYFELFWFFGLEEIKLEKP